MANSFNADYIINRKSSEVFAFLCSQMRIADMEYRMNTQDPQVVSFEVPNTAFKYGQQILVHVYDNDESTSIVKMLSRNLNGMQIVDGGKNQKNCETIARLLQMTFSAPAQQQAFTPPPAPPAQQQAFTPPPAPPAQPQAYTPPPFAMAPIPQKKSHGCLIALGIVAGLIILVIAIAVITYELGLR